MTIEKHIDGDQNITLALSGDIDTTTFLQLREAVTAVSDDIGRLTLDFRDVRVITSAGLRELLVCAQRFGEERLLRTLEDLDHKTWLCIEHHEITDQVYQEIGLRLNFDELSDRVTLKKGKRWRKPRKP